MADVAHAEALRQQDFHLLADEAPGAVAEQGFDLAGGKDDDPVAIDDDHRVRRGVEHAAYEFGAEHSGTGKHGCAWIGSHRSPACATRGLASFRNWRSEYRNSPYGPGAAGVDTEGIGRLEDTGHEQRTSPSTSHRTVCCVLVRLFFFF